MIRNFFLQRLARITSSGNYIPEIDGLRFVAIFGVIFFHLNGYLLHKSPIKFHKNALTDAWVHLFNQGGFGVKLFFTISGFILALPFASHYLKQTRKVSLGSYYRKRLTRLEPPYILCLLILFGMLVVFKGWTFTKTLLPNLGASLLYVHNIVFGTMSKINGVAWSLEVEVQFYILVPLLVMSFRLPTLWRRGLFLAVMLVNSFAVLPMLPYNPLHVFGYMQYFLGGFFLADLFLSGLEQQKTKWADLWILLIVAGTIAASMSRWWLTLTFPFAVFLSIYCVFRSHLFSKLFSNVYVRTIGGMCYSIYLFHFAIISLVGRFSIRFFHTKHFILFYILQALIIIPAILVCSGLFYMLVERPCMDNRWPEKFWAWIRRKPYDPTS